MLKAGRKTKEWNKIRAELVTRFRDADITACELRLHGCFYDNYLGFAHLDKRRYVDNLYEVVLCCSSCHAKIEYIGRTNMKELLQNVISNRVRQP